MEKEEIEMFVGKNVRISTSKAYEGEWGILKEIKNESVLIDKRYDIGIHSVDICEQRIYARPIKGFALIDIDIIHSIKEEKRPTSKNISLKKEIDNFFSSKIIDDEALIKLELFSISTLDMKTNKGKWNLIKNRKNKRSLIAIYHIHAGHRFEFSPNDTPQEILFKAFDKENKKIVEGELEILLASATWECIDLLYRQDISCMNSVKSHQLGKWRYRRYGVAGDNIVVYFTSKKEIDLENSVLSIRMRVRKNPEIIKEYFETIIELKKLDGDYEEIR